MFSGVNKPIALKNIFCFSCGWLSLVFNNFREFAFQVVFYVKDVFGLAG
jgi:hypothetical protein